MGNRPEPSSDAHGVAEALQLTRAVSERHRRPEITTVIYSAARACGYEVVDAHWDTYPMSFHWVELKQGERRFALLIHESSPCLALTSAIPQYFNLIFIDDAALALAMQQLDSPLQLLSASELRRPLTDEDRDHIGAVSDQHQRDLKYWKPETVGDVIFNWWD